MTYFLGRLTLLYSCFLFVLAFLLLSPFLLMPANTEPMPWDVLWEEHMCPHSFKQFFLCYRLSGAVCGQFFWAIIILSAQHRGSHHWNPSHSLYPFKKAFFLCVLRYILFVPSSFLRFALPTHFISVHLQSCCLNCWPKLKTLTLLSFMMS